MVLRDPDASGAPGLSNKSESISSLFSLTSLNEFLTMTTGSTARSVPRPGRKPTREVQGNETQCSARQEIAIQTGTTPMEPSTWPLLALGFPFLSQYSTEGALDGVHKLGSKGLV